MTPGPDDTLPPSSGSKPTLPSPPPSSSAGELPIAAGDAEYRVSRAMDQLVRSVIQIEQVAMSLARWADGQKEPADPTTA